MPIRNSRLLLATGAIMVTAALGLWLSRPAGVAPENRTESIQTAAAGPSVVGLSSTLPPVGLPLPTSAPAAAAQSIDSILTDPALDNAGAARALAALVQDPTLTEEARSEALAHLLNLSVGDETKLLLPVITSPQLPDALAATILTDALNRTFPWQADACMAVMARPTGKELHTQAREHLAFLVGEDHGDDLKAWTLALRDLRAKWSAEAP